MVMTVILGFKCVLSLSPNYRVLSRGEICQLLQSEQDDQPDEEAAVDEAGVDHVRIAQQVHAIPRPWRLDRRQTRAGSPYARQYSFDHCAYPYYC